MHELCQCPVLTLGAKVNRVWIEAAECAVVLGAPPAAARGFHLKLLRNKPWDGGAFDLHEVVAKVREWECVHIGDAIEGRRGDCAGPVAVYQARNRGDGSMSCEAVDQGWKALFRFTRDDVVDEGERSMEAEAHQVLAICATKYDRFLWIVVLDATRESQGGHVLLEH